MAERVAVVDGETMFTYGQLRQYVGRCTARLLGCGVRDGHRVALLADKSFDAVVGILSTLNAGATYVPLDIQSPPARLAQMLDTVAPAWVLADRSHLRLALDTLHGLGSCGNRGLLVLEEGEVRPVDVVRPDLGRRPTRPEPEDAAESDAPAVIFFTSGTTGAPKGVPLNHTDLDHIVRWSTTHFGTCPGERLSLHPPLIFDASLWDIMRALTSGAELHLVRPQVNLLPTTIRDFIRSSRLTQWDSVPGVLAAIAGRDVLCPDDFPDLRLVISYGDVLAPSVLSYWMERLPHVEFINTYGPTEITVTASFHDVGRVSDGAGDAVPIGRPVPGKHMLVVDDDGRPARPGEIGELLLGGVGVSSGYWRDSVRTAESFVTNPLRSSDRWYRSGDLAHVDQHGTFHFHGRCDRQVKVRGRRIELDEIANAVTAVTALADSAVVAIHAGGIEGVRICCAFVPCAVHFTGLGDVRAQLAASLPTYMIPTVWRQVSIIPRNRNGKIDHHAVEAEFADSDSEPGQR